MRQGRAARLAALVLAGMCLIAACGDGGGPAERPRQAVGFIFIGNHDDLGYNQATWDGFEAVARAFPDLDVIAVENVPESDAAVDALEDLIDRGATILFATSFGHLEAAYEVASRHPEVTVVHQGGVEPQPRLDNFGTYFGTHAEAFYAAGVAAGAATETGRLGFVVAFRIPAMFNNVNAFLLGARRTRPDATIDVEFTDSWCDPAAQAAAAQRLIDSGVDVLAQHQDCTATVLTAAEGAGIAAVGYHSDGSEVAPTAWLTGAVWTWSDLFVDIVDTVLAGEFVASPYNGDFRGTFAHGDNPFALAEFGPRVEDQTRQLIDSILDQFRAGAAAVFSGPLTDDHGVLREPAGAALTIADIDAMDYFLDGVHDPARR